MWTEKFLTTPETTKHNYAGSQRWEHNLQWLCKDAFNLIFIYNCSQIWSVFFNTGVYHKQQSCKLLSKQCKLPGKCTHKNENENYHEFKM